MRALLRQLSLQRPTWVADLQKLLLLCWGCVVKRLGKILFSRTEPHFRQSHLQCHWCQSFLDKDLRKMVFSPLELGEDLLFIAWLEHHTLGLSPLRRFQCCTMTFLFKSLQLVSNFMVLFLPDWVSFPVTSKHMGRNLIFWF